MSFRTCFPFSLAAGATLTQNCNIDLPTYKTARGLNVEIVNVSSADPVVILVGTMTGTTFSAFAAGKEATTATAGFCWYDFEWDYATQQVSVQVTNLSSTSNNYYMTITSGS